MRVGIKGRCITTDTVGNCLYMDELLIDQAWKSKDGKKHFFEPTYSGALSFLRRPYTSDLSGVDVAVTGIPFDCAVTYRPGSRLGPRAIRAASVQLAELKAFPWNFSIPEYLNVVDIGDCFLNPHEPSSIFDSIHDHATKTIKVTKHIIISSFVLCLILLYWVEVYNYWQSFY